MIPRAAIERLRDELKHECQSASREHTAYQNGCADTLAGATDRLTALLAVYHEPDLDALAEELCDCGDGVYSDTNTDRDVRVEHFRAVLTKHFPKESDENTAG